jgi:hypothetical protein
LSSETLTAAHLAHLEEMYATGVIESETAEGKRVRFASQADLWTRINRVKKILRGRRKTRVGYFSPEGD